MFKKITRKNIDNFLSRFATNELVLDLGAGRVSTNHSYIKYYPNRICVDVDPARNPDIVADIHKLPFDNETHNFVLCTEVLEHLNDPQMAVDEIQRVMRVGGTLVLTTRFIFPLHDIPHDYFRYTKYGLKYLFRDWDILEIVDETKSFSALAALFQRVGFQTHLRGGKATKLIIYLMSWILTLLDFLIIQEYGNIQKTSKENNILSTGYYLVAKKK